MSTGTIDKALAYIGNFLKNLVTVKQVTSSTVTITANGSATFSLDMSKEGYTPVGLRQLQNNSGSTTVINGYWWSGNTLNVYMKNTTSSAQSVYCIATVAYVKIVGG